MNEKTGKHLPASLILGALAVGTAALYQGLVVRRYILHTPKWKQGGSARFVVVSDLHSTLFGSRQQEILDTIRTQRPDYILLLGDIVDERRPVDNALMFLRGCAKIAPTYYVTGNHEYYIQGTAGIKEMVRRCGVTVLADRFVTLCAPGGPLILAGSEDPCRQWAHPRYRWSHAMASAFATLRGSHAYTMLLSHRPERARLYMRSPFDLVVSGHAHGGQMRIPGLINGLFAPNQGVFPRYAGGSYHHRGMTHVVSRGVAVYPRLPRVWNPPEIVVMELRGDG